MNYESPIVTVDVPLFTLLDHRLHVALGVREKAPEIGKACVTGGYIHTNEDVNDEAAALRILREKVDFVPRYVEQAFTEANQDRDERGWSVSIVWLALTDSESLVDLVARRGMKLHDIQDGGANLPEHMAFDHRQLVMKAAERLRSKAAYSTIVAHMLPREFSIPELQDAYEAVRHKQCNAANFRTKILKEQVLVEANMLRSGGRPATGYTLKEPIAYFDRELY